MKELNKKAQQNILGGRDVQKIDTDGDGEWDIKVISKKNRTIIKFRK